VPVPTLEIDPMARALYIRFSRAKVHRSVADEDYRPGVTMVRDLDARNNLIGLELVGVLQFSIKLIRNLLPEDLKELDLDSARWLPAATCASEPIAA